MQAKKLEYSLGNFNNLFDFKRLFEKIKDSFEKEQKRSVFQKKS